MQFLLKMQNASTSHSLEDAHSLKPPEHRHSPNFINLSAKSVTKICPSHKVLSQHYTHHYSPRIAWRIFVSSIDDKTSTNIDSRLRLFAIIHWSVCINTNKAWMFVNPFLSLKIHSILTWQPYKNFKFKYTNIAAKVMLPTDHKKSVFSFHLSSTEDTTFDR